MVSFRRCSYYLFQKKHVSRSPADPTARLGNLGGGIKVTWDRIGGVVKHPKTSKHTVDGRNPAPPDMYETL